MNNTKEFIIDQAFDLFLEHSYEAVSISDISKAIGFTKGALYHHFINKEELFKAVIDKYLVFTGTNADADNVTLAEYNNLILNSAEKTLKRLFSKNSNFIPIHYVTLIADGFRHYPGFAGDKEKFFTEETAKTKKILENAIKRKEIRKNIDASVIATMYFSVTIGLASILIQNSSTEQAIDALKNQLSELYKLLKD